MNTPMNTTNEAVWTMPQTGECKQKQDQFSGALLLWLASFPLFAIGLSLSGGFLHTLGLLMVLAAGICFASPITLLLGCLNDRGCK